MATTTAYTAPGPDLVEEQIPIPTLPASARHDSVTKDTASMSHLEKADPEDPVSHGPVDQFGGEVTLSPEERRLVRKLDFRIMPILWCMYFLNYLDRSAIAQARLNGLEANLGLVGGQFNVAVSILFAGYTVAQVPSNMLMSTKKVRPSLWMACWMMAWAVISACTALAKDYTSMFVIRLLLGIAEAPFYPGAIYLLALFYPRREIATRLSILYSANIMAISFSGLISAATFATLDGAKGLHGWQWLYIIEGTVTFAVAFTACVILPDHPLTTRWLTPEERILAQERMDRDTVGMEPSRGALVGLKQAIVDPKLWVLVIMQTCHLSSVGFNSFFPTVVSALGFSSIITLVLTCPPYLVAGACAVALGYSSGRFNERTWHITASMILAIVGFVISCITLNVGARYTSCFLFCIGAYGANSIILGWVSATCGQTQEKKAASLSIVNMFANASFIYTPYLYPSTDGPKYLMANSANAAFSFGTLVCAWILKVWLQRENRKISQSSAAGAENKLLFAY